MEVKPDPRGRLAGIRDDAAARRARAAVVTCADLAGMTAALEGYAVALLDAAGAGGGDGNGSGSDTGSNSGAALRAVRAVVAGTDAGRDAVAALRRSRDIAVGAAPPGAAWAVGQAFRQLYPAIVGRVADRTRPPLVGFGALARTLERVAFGPTPDNASRLLALIDAGVVDCADLADPTAVDRALAGGAAPGDAATPDAVVAGHGAAAAATSDAPTPAAADVVVDAVLPPAGIVPGTLLAETLARHGVDAAEVSVDPDGAVAGLPASPSPGATPNTSSPVRTPSRATCTMWCPAGRAASSPGTARPRCVTRARRRPSPSPGAWSRGPSSCSRTRGGATGCSSGTGRR